LMGGGELADLAPTVLSLLGVKDSPHMSGKDLLTAKDLYEHMRAG
jgi:bisphosphoglycerate-independent phosphoglycerate mutase (AlkP superfamily)